MVEECTKLLEDKRSIFKKCWGKFSEHKETINAVATIALVLVSIVLILVTIYSAMVARDLGKIELYLAAERTKEEIRQQIILAEDLLVETNRNKVIINITQDGIEEIKNTSGVKEDLIKIDKIQQAIDNPNFGSVQMRLKFASYFDALNLLKEHLSMIKKTAENGDFKVKAERVDAFKRISNQLLFTGFANVKIDDFIGDIEGYIKERRDVLNKIDEETKGRLLKLLN